MDYYQLLGVGYDAPLGQIRARYRLLARQMHPDGQNLGTVEAFSEITKAYRVLSNAQRRTAYNQSLGIFVRPRGLHMGLDVYQRIYVTDSEAADGIEVALSFTRYEPCKLCWLAGCDFCQQQGMIPDVVTTVIRVYPRTMIGSTLFLDGIGGRSEPGDQRGNLIVYVDRR